MTTKHTHGPWIANKNHCACTNDAKIAIEQEGGSAPIAMAFASNTLSPDVAQLMANASLIAAAPDLLAALQALLDMDVAYQRGPIVEAAVDVAAAAIAKATGN